MCLPRLLNKGFMTIFFRLIDFKCFFDRIVLRNMPCSDGCPFVPSSRVNEHWVL